MSEELEPRRPTPDFRVIIRRAFKAEVDVTDAVMDVYDIAINSMDFGSGFLSTEEVGNLRMLGEAIGADRFDYQYDKCLRCGCEQTSSCHYAPEFRPKRQNPDGTWGELPDACSCAGFINAEYPVTDKIERQNDIR